MEAWLKALPTYGLQPIKCGSFSLDPAQVAAVERLVAQQQKNATKTLKLKVKPWTLFKVCLPGLHLGGERDLPPENRMTPWAMLCILLLILFLKIHEPHDESL